MVQKFIAAFATAVLVTVPALRPADAAVVFTVTQQGADVLFSGIGSVDLAGLTYVNTVGGVPVGISPNTGYLITGGDGSLDVYSGFSGPSGFGTGIDIFADSDLGDDFGISAFQGLLAVPVGYASGDPLSATLTFHNQTFSSLGLTPNTSSVWTWGLGTNADSLTIRIADGGTVPLPSSLSLVLLAGGAALGVRRRARRNAGR